MRDALPPIAYQEQQGMTTVHRVEVKCGNCGHASEQIVVMSTNAFGAPDLDTRPPEMARSTLPFYVQCCPSCGYCARDLYDTLASGVEDVLHSSEYEDLLKLCDLPLLAREFLCLSLIYAHMSKFNGAGWACLRSAWVCDDHQDVEGAVGSRLRALAFFDRAAEEGLRYMTNALEEDVLRIDLLRRAEQFDAALELCQRVQESAPAGLIGEIVAFQRHLITQRDTAAHTIEEARGRP